MSEVGGIFEPPGRWGLLPDRVDGAPLDTRAVLRHWLVHFNPLYLLSAFCVLTGVFLVNRSLDGLPADAFDGPRLALLAVIQAYEILIIAGAAFLVRRARVVRPAVLLILLEAVFLFDGTLRLESLLLRAPLRFELTLVWLALMPAKVWGMAGALRVRLTVAHYAQVVASAALLAAVVHLLAHPSTDKLLVLQIAAWLGAFVIGLLDVTEAPPLSPLAATREERARATRCSRGAFRIVTGAYFVHVWSFILVGSSAELAWPAVVGQLGTLFLRAALRSPHDAQIWAAGVLVVSAALPNPAALPYAALVTAAVFTYRVWTGARGGLAAAAALSVYAALWLHEWRGWGQPLPALPAADSWPSVALAVVLAVIGWGLRDRLAQTLVAAGAAYAGGVAWPRIVPKTELARGVLMLAAGFVFFVVGLTVNWWLRVNGTSPRTR
jgi:hypothetical protein